MVVMLGRRGRSLTLVPGPPHPFFSLFQSLSFSLSEPSIFFVFELNRRLFFGNASLP